jgi:hypothetical protein
MVGPKGGPTIDTVMLRNMSNRELLQVALAHSSDLLTIELAERLERAMSYIDQVTQECLGGLPEDREA